METEFAAPERATEKELASDISDIRDLVLVRELTQLIPDAFLILNIHRQIIYANPTIARLMDISSPERIYGMRPGEALNCIHSKAISEGGCGTSRHCRYCGAVNAVLDSQDAPGTMKVSECRLVTGTRNQSFDFSVRAKTLHLLDRHFTLVIVQDISAEKRRTILERLFFHDILNTAGGLRGIFDLMQQATREELDELLTLADGSIQAITKEIHAQRDLLAAEQNRLEPECCRVNTMDILTGISSGYKDHPRTRSGDLRIDPKAVSAELTTDPILLGRIIDNLVKNALEAESEGVAVTMGAAAETGQIEFWVHNPSEMPDKVKFQVFQRSFSTKGEARGLGTYSTRLLGENYLNGKVGFTSDRETGTRFFIRLPVEA
ncbi:MAG: PAS domain-containing sensor histidine kinase [Desulfobacter sp.]